MRPRMRGLAHAAWEAFGALERPAHAHSVAQATPGRGGFFPPAAGVSASRASAAQEVAARHPESGHLRAAPRAHGAPMASVAAESIEQRAYPARRNHRLPELTALLARALAHRAEWPTGPALSALRLPAAKQRRAQRMPPPLPHRAQGVNHVAAAHRPLAAALGLHPSAEHAR